MNNIEVTALISTTKYACGGRDKTTYGIDINGELVNVDRKEFKKVVGHLKLKVSNKTYGTPMSFLHLS